MREAQVSMYLACGVVLTESAVLLASSPAYAQRTSTHAVFEFDIPAQRLAESLRAVATTAGVTVAFDPRVVGDKGAPPVVGSLSVQEALERLLKDSGLNVHTTNGGSFLISQNESVIAPHSGQNTGVSMPNSRKWSFLGAMVAFLSGGAHPTLADEQPSRAADAVLEEIVVTAQKRDERLQDVPVPVTAIGAADLIESNQVRLQDYYTSIPGLSVSPSIQATQVISIRGITTGGGNPTVGVVVDDVPFGGSTNIGSGLVVPDFDPSDLKQVEVLRGPQGTLYGVASLGGLIKYVTVNPSTQSLTGRLQVGANSIRNGNDVGYNVRGAVNVPISDTLALRASGFYRQDPGYIDDPRLGTKGVNEADVYGGRLSSLWKPSADFSVKLSALFQRSRADASSDVFPGVGALDQDFAVPDMGAYDVKSQAYSATIKAKVGVAEVTSVTGYNVINYTDTLDYTPTFGPFAPGVYGPGVTAAPFFEDSKTSKISQELRSALALGPQVDWLVGFFYTYEDATRRQQVLAENPLTGAIPGNLVALMTPATYKELAGFTDFTWHATDRFDIQMGGRQSHNSQTYQSTRSGPFGGASAPLRRSSDSKFTFLVTPEFRISDDAMVYARVASGYQAGGPNNAASLAAGVPPQYDPSNTVTYEIGSKGNLSGGALTFDSSVYYIDWKDIQLNLTGAAGSYMANGGRAKSEGVELSVESHPITGLTIAAWAAWNDAELTERLPAQSTAYGAEGDRLPFSSRFSASLSATEEFRPIGAVTPFVGASVSYIGDRLSTFNRLSAGVPLPRQRFGAYAKTDLRAGVRYNAWVANLYANNLTDRRGELAGGIGAFNPRAFAYIQPRTIGINVVRNF